MEANLFLIITVLLVHILKSSRLYIILYGEKISRRKYLETYCMTTPVSILIPFKLGEFFRMFAYGRAIGNYLKGVIIILLDRFMDTLALLTIIIAKIVFFNGRMDSLTWFFVFFLVLLLVVYTLFPKTIMYWKNFFLTSSATPRKLKALKWIELSISIYTEIRTICQGRGAILYGLSLLAWGIEVSGLMLQVSGAAAGQQVVSRYLSAAIGSGSSIELQRFVIASVILLAATWIVLKIIDFIMKKRSR